MGLGEGTVAEVLASQARWCVVPGDCLDALQFMPTHSIDLVVTDPAYESLEKHRAKGTTTRLKHSKSSSNDWFEIFPNSLFPLLFSGLHRVLRKDRHLYLYCDQETMFVVKPIAEKFGFKFWKPLIWDKVSIGMGYHYRCRYELVLFFEKGKRKLDDLGVPDIITEKRLRGGYPTEKPVRVSEVLIEQSAEVGELVFDPFCGSGSVGEAALRKGCRFIGIDSNAGAVALSRERLGRTVQQLTGAT